MPRNLIEPIVLGAEFPLPLDAPFTKAMALAEGVTPNRLSQLVSVGALRRPIRNVYLSSGLADSTGLRVQCLALVVPADCTVVDRHAGWLHGAEMVLAPGEHLDIAPIAMFRPAGGGRLRNAYADSGERNLIPADIVEVHGIAVTSRLRTIWDLGRQRQRNRSYSGMCAMARLGGVDLEEMRAGIGRFRGMRWVTRLKEFSPHVNPDHESPGECALWVTWKDTGLPLPQPQREFYENGRLVYRSDLALEELLLIGEYKGQEWHSSDAQRQRDRERTEWLERHGRGWRVEEFVAHDVYHPTGDAFQRLQTAARELRATQRRSA